MKRLIYDITPPISSALEVWPGDTPPSRDVLFDMKKGANITLSTLRATVHLGAHADAPSHYGRDGIAIHECSLEPYLGLCQVIAVEVEKKSRVQVSDLKSPVRAERVLIRTGTFPDSTAFNQDFAALAPELVESLHHQGVRLVGIDTPSVDLFDSTDLPSHRMFLKTGMAILEGLDLSAVPEGLYELIALPLNLVGFDASPVRAVLRRLAEESERSAP